MISDGLNKGHNDQADLASYLIRYGPFHFFGCFLWKLHRCRNDQFCSHRKNNVGGDGIVTINSGSQEAGSRYTKLKWVWVELK